MTATDDSVREAALQQVEADLRVMFSNPFSMAVYVGAEGRLRDAFHALWDERESLRRTLLGLGVGMANGIDLRDPPSGVPTSVVLAVDPSWSTPPAAALTPIAAPPTEQADGN